MCYWPVPSEARVEVEKGQMKAGVKYGSCRLLHHGSSSESDQDSENVHLLIDFCHIQEYACHNDALYSFVMGYNDCHAKVSPFYLYKLRNHTFSILLKSLCLTLLVRQFMKTVASRENQNHTFKPAVTNINPFATQGPSLDK